MPTFLRCQSAVGSRAAGHPPKLSLNMPDVSLRQVAAETVRAICALEVRPEQRGYVATNALSIAQAYFQPRAWFRAIYADTTPVGFVMLDEDPKQQEYFLWRLMIDADHQGKGYGRRALDLVVEHVRSLPGARELRSSYVPGDNGPAEFYRSYGFVETGEMEGAEVVIRLDLEGERPRQLPAAG
jgi:diamine N-acetyltransferase